MISSAPLQPTAVRTLPNGPVFGWSNFEVEDAPRIPSVEDLLHVAFTTSGRAAIFQALQQTQIPPGSTVLVPTYHCPTMIAPVLLAGHQPAYFGIRADGLPDVAHIDPTIASQARAMVVSHYFGLAQSLREVRAWCDARGIYLIEDCAHCYFGNAGERPIGAWGDYCTASLSKFLPVPEAGLLGSAHHALRPMRLTHQGLMAQIKGGVDVVEKAVQYQRLKGLNHLLASVFKIKTRAREAVNVQESDEQESADTMMRTCDMARIQRRPLAASMLLRRILPRGRVIARRQHNFSVYAQLLVNLRGAKAMASLPAQPVAPYVFPVWVEDADRVYHALKEQGIPVFRWDRIWSGTPVLPHDAGLDWSHHVLQLLCHQDLAPADIKRSAQCLKDLLKITPTALTSSALINEPQLCPL